MDDAGAMNKVETLKRKTNSAHVSLVPDSTPANGSRPRPYCTVRGLALRLSQKPIRDQR
jgi:hypothetical protein